MNARRSGSLFVSVLLLTTVGVGATSFASTTDEQWLPSIESSDRIGGSPIMSGTLLDSRGAPFKDGAKVELRVLPSIEAGAAAAVGDELPVYVVGKDTVARGNFSLKVPASMDLRRFADDREIIQFEVQAYSGDELALYSFSESVDNLTRPSAAPEPRRAQVRSVGRVSRIEELLTNAGGATLGKTDICGKTKITTYNPVNVVVGGTYLSTTGTADFQYASGASSTLGIGYSVSGTYGSFSKSGSASLSGTSETDFDTHTSGGREHRTTFRFAKWGNWCYPVYGPVNKKPYAYVVQPDSHSGGGTSVTVSVPTANYCVYLDPNVSHTQTTSTAYEWATGAKMTYYLGIDLNSRTGYTSSAKIVVKNTSGSKKRLCGTSNYPGSSPKRLVLKS